MLGLSGLKILVEAQKSTLQHHCVVLHGACLKLEMAK